MMNDLIFDVGMCQGDDTEFYLRQGFRVVAIEANPQLAAAVSQRLSAWISDKRLTVVNVGVAAAVGEMPFYVNKNPEWSSFVSEWGMRGNDYSVQTIPTAPLGDLLNEFGTPHYLKIDIEGHDDLAVAALENSDHRPRYVSVEASVANFWNRMHAIGYGGFKYVNQRWRPSFSSPTGSSGPFGEATYGPWLSLEEFQTERDILFDAAFGGHPERIAESRQHRECGVPLDQMLPPWYDWHARYGLA